MTYSTVVSPYRLYEPEPESLTPEEQTTKYIAFMRKRAAMKREYAQVLRRLAHGAPYGTPEVAALMFAVAECDRQASINEWMADNPSRSSKECHL